MSSLRWSVLGTEQAGKRKLVDFQKKRVYLPKNKESNLQKYLILFWAHKRSQNKNKAKPNQTQAKLT